MAIGSPGPQQIQLPEIVKLVLPAQHAAVVLGALAEYGPYKTVQPVINNIEQQLVGQQLKSDYEGPVPGAPTSLEAQRAARARRPLPISPVAPVAPVPGVPIPPVDNDHVAPGCEQFDRQDSPPAA